MWSQRPFTVDKEFNIIIRASSLGSLDFTKQAKRKSPDKQTKGWILWNWSTWSLFSRAGHSYGSFCAVCWRPVLSVCGHCFSRQAVELTTHSGLSQQLATSWVCFPSHFLRVISIPGFANQQLLNFCHSWTSMMSHPLLQSWTSLLHRYSPQSPTGKPAPILLTSRTGSPSCPPGRMWEKYFAFFPEDSTAKKTRNGRFLNQVILPY